MSESMSIAQLVLVSIQAAIIVAMWFVIGSYLPVLREGSRKRYRSPTRPLVVFNAFIDLSIMMALSVIAETFGSVMPMVKNEPWGASAHNSAIFFGLIMAFALWARLRPLEEVKVFAGDGG